MKSSATRKDNGGGAERGGGGVPAPIPTLNTARALKNKVRAVAFDAQY